jgi:peptidoglycan/xylan/chitin deacetylase (PgdA/CDA1 family)
MGKQTNRWVKGAFYVFVAGMLLMVTGVSVTHFLKAEPVSNEPVHPKKAHPITTEKQGKEKVAQMINGSNPDKELTHQDQKEPASDKTVPETSNVPENKTPTAQQPNDVNTASPPPPSDINTGQPEQVNTVPAASDKKTVYLTFDDGPESFSGEIIQLLEQYHFKATFFMLDGNIRKHPDSARLMVQMGESVGLHGVSHSRKLFYASVDSVLGEMNQDRATLKEITGVDTVLIRTPFGSVPNLTPEEKKAVLDNGYMMWDWNIDSQDWYFKDGRFVDNVISQLQRRAGKPGPTVILMHEKRETLANLPRLLEYLSQQHYEGKAIDPTMEPFHF